GTYFFIDSDKSTVVALVVNVLIQNSLKYEFPNGAAGLIEVTTASDGKIKMIEVKDNGVGYKPGQIKTNSLGLSIVKSYVYEKLVGKLIIETGSEGTKTSFAFKL
ncbi:MAG: sensor histidine kinase, partial [Acetobacterium sp.]|nr:sensor histidine kinase [Acetobacterium sp.]